MKRINPKISVIVPVYNVEKFIPRCIDSILSQTFTDFELLLIDDGSKDKSGKICDEYAKKDSRIRVFHKDNGGVASARQVGIENANGIYSIHADGDDWMEPLMFERMYLSITRNDSDILISDFYVDSKNKVIYRKQKTKSTKNIDILCDILKGKLFGALWHKMIRHSLYKEYDISFFAGINYCEDVLVLSQLLQKDIKVSFLHESYYHYDQQNTNSITRNYTRATFDMRKSFVYQLTQILPPSLNNIIKHVAFHIKLEAFTHGKLTQDDFENYYPTPLSYILFDKYREMYKIYMLIAYLGFFPLAEKLRNMIKSVKHLLFKTVFFLFYLLSGMDRYSKTTGGF